MCPCKGCKHSIGGTLNCRQNLEGECRDGGGYEAWEPATLAPQKDELPRWLYWGSVITVWAAGLCLVGGFIYSAFAAVC